GADFSLAHRRSALDAAGACRAAGNFGRRTRVDGERDVARKRSEMRGRPRISLSLIRATFCRNPRLDVAATLQTPNRGAERKISSPIDLVPLAGTSFGA